MSEERAVYDTGPMTVEAARALPEVSGALRFTDKPTRLGPSITDDSICWFVDADGRSMRVIATDSGFAKTEM
jgi:hypothetical protein